MNTTNKKTPTFVIALLAAGVFALITLFAFLVSFLSAKPLPADQPAVEHSVTQ
jgi:hypothetical protein